MLKKKTWSVPDASSAPASAMDTDHTRPGEKRILFFSFYNIGNIKQKEEIRLTMDT